jgi:translation initiation factor eIF-2B subunit alpha
MGYSISIFNYLLIMNDDEIRRKFTQNLRVPKTSHAHAAIRTLAQVISKSNETTVQGLSVELVHASEVLQQDSSELMGDTGRTPLSVMAGCDMYRYHTLRSLSDGDSRDFPKIKEELVAQGIKLADMREDSLEKITELAMRLFRDNLVILVHGYSGVVVHVLEKAAESFRITVYVTECRPHCEGYTMCEKLAGKGVPFKLILDNAVAGIMENVDVVMVGAEAIVESGGIINRVGTQGVALIAKAFQRPFYVFTESIKFLRLFPLSMRDLPASTTGDLKLLQEKPCLVGTKTPYCDLTPPSLVTLVFTDLGILTPSAISDELIQLYSG